MKGLVSVCVFSSHVCLNSHRQKREQVSVMRDHKHSVGKERGREMKGKNDKMTKQRDRRREKKMEKGKRGRLEIRMRHGRKERR